MPNGLQYKAIIAIKRDTVLVKNGTGKFIMFIMSTATTVAISIISGFTSLPPVTTIIAMMVVAASVSSVCRSQWSRAVATWGP